MEIGELIRRARLANKLSQRRLAELVGVNKSAVAQWELGSTLPKGHNMAAVRRILSIDDNTAAPSGQPFAGQIVDDPDELALLWLWRILDRDERKIVLRMIDPNNRRFGSAA